jgi:hypothetical protein
MHHPVILLGVGFLAVAALLLVSIFTQPRG